MKGGKYLDDKETITKKFKALFPNLFNQDLKYYYNQDLAQIHRELLELFNELVEVNYEKNRKAPLLQYVPFTAKSRLQFKELQLKESLKNHYELWSHELQKAKLAKDREDLERQEAFLRERRRIQEIFRKRHEREQGPPLTESEALEAVRQYDSVEDWERKRSLKGRSFSRVLRRSLRRSRSKRHDE